MIPEVPGDRQGAVLVPCPDCSTADGKARPCPDCADEPSTVLDILMSLAGWHDAELDTIRLVAKRLPVALGIPAADLPKAIAVWRRAQSAEIIDGAGAWTERATYERGWNDCLDHLRGGS